ncbi:MAG: hypothetical protein KIG36_03480 [Eubacteriales bacterium]|nr:hypothetical protein [Eubacteriales bacterium]
MFDRKYKRIIGLVLMAVGVVIVVAFVPFWLWLSVIGAALIAVGVALVASRC